MSLLDGLNPQQQAAVECLDGPVLILAGAGAGKTHTITRRAANLIAQGRCHPATLLVLTFTNKAAGELRARLAGLLDEDVARQVWALTFHALCVRILRRSGQLVGISNDFTIVDSDASRKLLRQAAINVEDAAGSDADELKRMKSIISRGKNAAQDADELESHDDPFMRRTGKVWEEYERLLREVEGLDFDDLLLYALRVFDTERGRVLWGGRFRYLLIDEHQDTNSVQSRLIKALAGDHDNVCVCGDEKQCQPAGTMVQTTDGSVAIEDLDPEQHTIISFDRRSSRLAGWRAKDAFRKQARSYTGPLVEVTAGGKTTVCTPNHRWPIQWIDREERSGWCATYLMRQGNRWCIGWCQVFSVNGSFHFRSRCRIERANAGWILGLYRDRTEASVRESIIAAQYGLPLVTFEPVNGAQHLTRDALDAIFSGLDPHEQEERALRCLRDHGRDLDHPLVTNGAVPGLDGRRPSLAIEAANLIPEIMRVPVPDETAELTAQTTVRWHPVQVRRTEPRTLDVFSLDVPDHHTYIADGLVTMNSIYRFRGAEVRNILRFTEEWPGANVFKLSDNYRSQANVITAANAIMAPSKERTDNVLTPTKSAGRPVLLASFETHYDEADWIAQNIKRIIASGVSPDGIAVAYRMNAQSQIIEEKLLAQGVKYRVIGGVEFNRRVEVQAVRAYLALLVNRRDRLAFERAIAWPKRGVGDVAVKAIAQNAKDEHDGDLRAAVAALAGRKTPGINAKATSGMSAFAAVLDGCDRTLSKVSLGDLVRGLITTSGIAIMLRESSSDTAKDQLANLDALTELAERWGKRPAADTLRDFLEATALNETPEEKTVDPAVALMTLHATKGLEFPVVFLPGLEEGMFLRPDSNPRDIEEARRLLYVGMTRAEEALAMSVTRSRRMYGTHLTAYPLRFLRDLPSDPAVVRREKIAGRGPATPPPAARRPGGPRRPGPPGRPGPSHRAARPASPSPGRYMPRPADAGRVPSPRRDTSVSVASFTPGQIVIHPKFGRGQVSACNASTLVIRFADGPRTLDPQLARLTKA